MTKHLVLCLFGAVVFGPAAYGQFGFAATIGAQTGRRISDQMNQSLRTGTRGFSTGGKQAKGGTAKAGAKAEANNVPPPPPPPAPLLRRAVSNTKKNTVPAWMLESASASEKPAAPAAEPLNVDLAQIERGMARESLLALGKPTSKMTLFEEGHLIEVYHYRNQTLASGVVRLRDGAVSAIEARP